MVYDILQTVRILTPNTKELIIIYFYFKLAVSNNNSLITKPPTQLTLIKYYDVDICPT